MNKSLKNNDKDDIQKFREMMNTMNEIIKDKNYDLDLSTKMYLTTFDNPISLYFQEHGFDNKLIFEGLCITYPIETTINYIKKYFNINDNHIISKENHILIQIPNINNNKQIIKKAFELCGYYQATNGKTKNINNVEWIVLQFEAKFEKDEEKKIRLEEKFLYHLTPSYNEYKILKNGFSPRCRNLMFNYPSRIYFIKGSVGDFHILHLGNQLFKNNISKGNNGKYTLFKIDISKIPKNTKMFLDNNYTHGIFITNNLKPNCIKNVGNIDFTLETPKIIWKNN